MIKECTNIKLFLTLLKNNDLSDNPYLSYGYLSTYLEYNSINKILIFICYGDKEQILGFIPLQKKNFYYTFVGHRASNYLGYICKDENMEEVHKEFTKYLIDKNKKIIINYYDINSNSMLFPLLNNDNNASSIFLYNCPYVDIDISFENVFSSCITSSKKRSEIKKFVKKLNLVGKVEFINIYDKETLLKYKLYINQIFKVHEDRFRDTFIPDEFCLYKNVEYYTSMINVLADKKQIFLSLLLIDNIVVSFVYALNSSDIVIDWMPAFDPAFSKFNLGTAHMKMLLEYLCDQTNFKVFDFSKGDGEYKKRWSTGVTENFMFIYKSHSTMQSNMIFSFLVKANKFKCKLRNSGNLEKIKHFLVIKHNNYSNKQKNSKAESTKILYINEEDKIDIDMKLITYKDIFNLSVAVRKEILDHLYNGEQCFAKYNNDNTIIIIIKRK